MAQSYVQVPVDGAGKKIDAWVTAVATQYRQSIVIADPDTDANVVAISSRLRLPVELEQLFDFDTGAGSSVGSGVGIMLPASGGPVIAGVVAQPIFVRLSDGATAIATLPVSIAATVTVTGPLTDTQLRATPVPVSGTVTTGGLTDTQLRATPVPVSGTVTANAGTNLNTSALALEAGNLATLAGIVSSSKAAIKSADGDQATIGITTGAAVITDANGTLQQYLRGLIKLATTAGSYLVTATIAAGSAIIGKVGIDQTTPGTTNAVSIAQIGANTVQQNSGANGTGVQRVTVATDDALNAVLGTTAGAAVITDATGTIQQYLRGLVKLAITAGSFLVTVQSKTIYQRQIFGSAQTVFNTATDIAAGNFSAAGTDFTNNDGTIGNAPYAVAMIEAPDWAAAPVQGTVVSLWGTLINVDSTDDDTDAPSGTSNNGARYFGSWIIAGADALQRRTITISLAGVENGFTPYIKNETAQNMNNDAGTNCVVKITPFTVVQVG